MVPADQRLCADQDRFLWANVIFRLIVDNELPLFDRLVEILEQLLFVDLFLM